MGVWGFPLSVYLNPNHKVRTSDVNLPMGYIGLAIDIYLFVIPLLAVSKLKSLTFRKRVGIALLFSAGFM